MEKKFNWMPVLRTGTFTDKNNQTVTIDELALDKIIAATDCTKEPQLVVEHPKFDEIGFGTIEQIKKVPSPEGKGWVLFALPKTVHEKFKAAVNSGKLPGRSVTLDKATYALKNISFLPPDVPPAVSGLGAYSFQEVSGQSAVGSRQEEQGTLNLQLAIPGVESHFADLESSGPVYAQDSKGRLEMAAEAIISFIKSTLTPEHDIQPEVDPALGENFQTPLPVGEDLGEGLPPNFNLSKNINGDTMSKIDLSKLDLSKADPQVKTALETLQAENTQLTTDLNAKNVELQTATAKISAAESEKLRSEVIQFCDGNEVKKKIKPADKDKFVNFLMSQKEKGVIEFSVANTSGGTTEKVQLNAYDFAKEIIKSIPDFISDSEIATGDKAGVPDKENAELIAQKALEFQSAEKKAGRDVSSSAAVAHVLGAMTK